MDTCVLNVQQAPLVDLSTPRRVMSIMGTCIDRLPSPPADTLHHSMTFYATQYDLDTNFVNEGDDDDWINTVADTEDDWSNTTSWDDRQLLPGEEDVVSQLPVGCPCGHQLHQFAGKPAPCLMAYNETLDE